MNTSPQLPVKSYLNKAHHPFLQAGVAGGLMVLFMLGAYLIATTGPEGFGDRMPWIVALAFLLLFAVFNSIFCLASSQVDRYWQRSVLAFIALGGVGILLAWLLSGQLFTTVGSFKWLYFVVSFCYLVFISIINFMRSIVNFAEKEEWNKPKLTSRKRGY